MIPLLIIGVGLAAGAFLAGCAADVPPCTDWAIDPDYTDFQKELILQAGERWNQFVGRQVFRFVIAKRETCAIQKNRNTHPDKRGYYSENRRVIELLPLQDSEDNTPWATFYWYHVALHELGHALGLGHTPPPSIMQETTPPNRPKDLTEIDREECRRVGVCQ